jgi:hypothetical protein
VLTRQSDFAIRSPEELAGEIKAAREAGLPGYHIAELIRSQVTLRTSADEYQESLLTLSEYVDPLHGIADAQIAMSAGRGVQPWQITLHVQFNALVNQLLRENEGFLELEVAEQARLLEEKARAVTASSNVAAGIIDGLGI